MGRGEFFFDGWVARIGLLARDGTLGLERRRRRRRGVRTNVVEMLQFFHFALDMRVVPIFVLAHFDQGVTSAVEQPRAVDIDGVPPFPGAFVFALALAAAAAAAFALRAFFFPFRGCCFFFFLFFLLGPEPRQGCRRPQFAAPHAPRHPRFTLGPLSVLQFDPCCLFIA